jgi:pimeloyl-ACP methyl ester carboxylesterase
MKSMEQEIQDKEVTWNILSNVPVYGTVTAPKDSEVHPAVVFLAGSGPTDRNWCSPLLPGTNGTAKILAEKLARRGYVTLRYDKLGSGPHVRKNLPRFAGKVGMETFVDELGEGVKTLVSEINVDRSKVFALTNSEGAIHAVNYQLSSKTTNRFKGFVLTGSPGRSVGDVARSQFLAQSRSLPNGELFMKHYDEAITNFIAGRPMVLDPSLPKNMEPFFRSLESKNNLPFSRELWIYNLPDHISKISDPILVVIGKKDIQMDWELDGAPLEKVIARGTFSYPANANHVLKHEEMPREKLSAEYVGTHYNSDEARLDEQAAGVIFDWLDNQAMRNSNSAR